MHHSKAPVLNDESYVLKCGITVYKTSGKAKAIYYLAAIQRWKVKSLLTG